MTPSIGVVIRHGIANIFNSLFQGCLLYTNCYLQPIIRIVMSRPTRWTSRTSFIFATAAAAIELRNIWRFRYLAAQNGGTYICFLYLLFVILLGVPLMRSEVLLGRNRASQSRSCFTKCSVNRKAKPPLAGTGRHDHSSRLFNSNLLCRHCQISSPLFCPKFVGSISQHHPFVDDS